MLRRLHRCDNGTGTGSNRGGDGRGSGNGVHGGEGFNWMQAAPVVVYESGHARARVKRLIDRRVALNIITIITLRHCSSKLIFVI